MPLVPITALYAGILGLISLVLAFQVGNLRGRTGIPILDAGNPEVAVAMRRHGNFVEYVPLALVLMGALELNGASALPLHVLGAGLVVCRVCHPFGIKADTIRSPWRLIGAAGTWLVTLVLSGWAIATFF